MKSSSSKSFRRFAAVCAVTTSITTVLLWALPFAYQSTVQNFNDQTVLYKNQFYLSRLWVNFIHVFLALIAYYAVFLRLSRRDTGFAGIGFICFFLWAAVELVGVSILLFAVNFSWRMQLAVSTDELKNAALINNINAFNDIWDALFFLLLIAFLIGSLIYGRLFFQHSETKLEKSLGICLLLAVPLTIFIIIGGYTSVTIFSLLIVWVYPILQPVSRLMMGIWLWKEQENSIESEKIFGEIKEYDH